MNVSPDLTTAPRAVRSPSRRPGPLPALLLGAVALLSACGGEVRHAEPPVDDRIEEAVDDVSERRLHDDLKVLVSFGTRHSRSETDSELRGIGAARRWLAARFADLSREHDKRLVVESRTHPIPAGPLLPEPMEVVNVVATIPGSDPDRVVIVSGHYDSRNSSDANHVDDAPGANDDGSGTVAVLEAARVVLAALGDDVPRASIRFVCVAGEEQGLLGSRAMAAVDRKNGVDVVAMLTMDIVGGVAGGNGKRNRGHIRLFSEGVPSGGGPPGTPPEQAVAIPVPTVVGSDNDAPSRQLARTIKELSRLYVPDLEVTLVFRQDRYLRGGDHKAYNEQGYTAVRFSDRYEHFDRQHQDVRVEDGRPYGDLIEHIDFVNLADVTRLNVAAVMALALAPPAPTGVVLDIRQLSHDTRVAWDDPGDMRTVGYRVRMRPTWAPEWSERVDLGRVFEHTFKGISKDDVVFAVEAYDVDGNTSIPVYPTPRR